MDKIRTKYELYDDFKRIVGINGEIDFDNYCKNNNVDSAKAGMWVVELIKEGFLEGTSTYTFKVLKM